jgi:hypothetical protein
VTEGVGNDNATRKRVIGAAVLVLVTLLAYLPAIHGGFIWDDDDYVTENVLLEVQKTFDFFKATAASDRIDRIVLSGGASRTDGFADMLQDRFETAVEAFDPFRTVACDARKLGGDPADLAPSAAVAVGLALRRVGDR